MSGSLRAEALERRILRILVAARHVRLQPEARTPGTLGDGEAGIGRDGPRSDGSGAEPSPLVHELEVVVPGPFQVRLFGKGRKERVCPLWPQTAEVLRTFLAERRVDPHSREALFRNHRGERLTRFGVRYLLAKYCHRAGVTAPTLAKKRLHPHSMRHSTAVHLLQAGVDMATITHWLGHASGNTTNRYATVDLQMKREAISKASPVTADGPAVTWRTDNTILQWLEAL